MAKKHIKIYLSSLVVKCKLKLLIMKHLLPIELASILQNDSTQCHKGAERKE